MRCASHPDAFADVACAVCLRRACAACRPRSPDTGEPLCADCAAAIARLPPPSTRSASTGAALAAGFAFALVVAILIGPPSVDPLDRATLALVRYHRVNGSFPPDLAAAMSSPPRSIRYRAPKADGPGALWELGREDHAVPLPYNPPP
jgi:hypothetical protein